MTNNTDFDLVVGINHGLSFEKFKEGISQLITDINKTSPKITVGINIDTKSIDQIKSKLSNLQSSVTSYGSAHKGASSVGTSGEQKSVKMLTSENKEYYNSLRQIQTLINQIADGQNKWTKAKKGSSRDSYNSLGAYISDLESLRSKVIDGSMSADDFSKKLTVIRSEFIKSKGAIRAAGEDTKTWSERIGGLAQKFNTWFSMSQVIMAAYRSVRKMIDNVIELDTAMTELKKVTDETDKAYEKFLVNASSRAKKLGSTLSDTVTATADFARLGYDISEAEKLADAAVIYKNVGDGITDINEASESVIATMQAFGIGAEDAMSIVDKFNAVGNNYAISSKGVGDAMLRSAAAMQSANNTLDETIALSAAANTIVQDPDKVGTTLKTVSMYLRAAKTDAEDAGESTDGMAESISELRNELLSLTGNKVDIQLDEDSFKSTYQILKELSKEWHNISDISQANILELVGGKRNSNVVAAILENFTVAEEAIKTSANSAGSALAENEKYLDSINGKMAVMEASFEDLSQNFIDGDLVKNIVDLATALLNFLNSASKVIDMIGGINNALFITIGILATIKADSIWTFISNTLVGKISSITKLVNGLATTFMTSFNTAIASGATPLRALSAAFDSVTISASSAQIAVAAFVAVIAIMNMIGNSIENARQEAISLNQQIAEEKSKIIDNSEAFLEACATYQKYKDISKLTTDQENSLNNAISTITDSIHAKTGALAGLTQKTSAYDKALGDIIRKEKEKLKLDAASEKINAGDALKDVSYSDWWGSQVTYYHLYRDYYTKKNAGLTSPDTRATDIAASVLSDYIVTDEHGLPDHIDLNWGYKAEYPEEVVAYYYKLIEARDKILADETLHNTIALKNINPVISTLSSSVDTYTKALYDEFKAGYNIEDGLIDTEKEYEEYKNALVEFFTNTFNDPDIGYNMSQENVSSIVGSFLSKESFNINTDDFIKKTSVIKKGIKDLSSESASYIDEMSESDLSIAYQIITENGSMTIDELKQRVDDTRNNIKSSQFVLNVSGVEKLSTGMDMIDKIYADVYDKGEFDWSSILNNEDFKQEFGRLGNEYSNFINVISNSPKDINACQDAFNSLVGAYITNSGALSGLTDETRNATIAILEQMGVANAAAIVDHQLAYQKAKLKYSTEEYANKAYEEIYSMWDAAKAASAEKRALGELLIAKTLANKEKIDSADDCAALIAIANTAGVTQESITNLMKAQELFDKAEAAREVGAQYWASSYTAKAEELLKKPIEYSPINLNDYVIDYKGSSVANKAKEEAMEQETWFDKQYKYHKHLLAMEKESEEDYLRWLDSAHKKAYEEKIIDLDNYYAYQEEVYQGLKDLFKDNLSDIEHEISMREGYDVESKNIINLYKNLMKSVENEIESSRSRGLNDSDDYIQELQSKWQKYADAIKEIREETTEEAKDAFEELVDYRIDMIKQEVEYEKDALDKKLDYLKEFYDKQKEMLQDQYDEEKYLEEQSEKRKSVSDIQSEIEQLQYDDSAWAQKRRLELQEELSEAQKDLSDFEDEHALDLALDALEGAYESQERQIQAEMDALDDKLNDPKALFNQALSDIKNNTANLYAEMLAYNRKHGTGNDDDVKEIYENAYKALDEYKDLYNKNYNNVSLPNSTGYKSETGSWNEQPVYGSGSTTDKPSSASDKNDKNNSKSYPYGKASETTGNIKRGAKGSAVKAIQYALNQLGYGNSGTKSLDGEYGSGTVKAVKAFQKAMGLSADGVVGNKTRAKFKTKGYYSGTQSATPGLHEVDEFGAEYLFTSKDGNRYRMFTGGEKVLNANATNFLYTFAETGGKILRDMVGGATGKGSLNRISGGSTINQITMSPITVQGNADSQTVSQLRRAQRESVQMVLKEFNKLQKQ